MNPFREAEKATIGSATGITAVETLADTDTLIWEGERLIVRSPRAMPEWLVGRNRKIAVVFRGVHYAVVEVREAWAESRRTIGFEYVLDPWEPGPHDNPGHTVHYGEFFVREREDDARRMAIARMEAWALVPLWPLFGWLPSSIKAVLEARYGFSPAASTRFSVLVELAMVAFGFVVVAFHPGAIFVLGAVFFDAFFRASILVDDDHPPFGFGEWLWRADWRSVVHALRAKVRRPSGSRDEPRDEDDD